MDWNGNGKHDNFDGFMDYKLSGSKNTGGGCLTSLVMILLPGVIILIGIIAPLIYG